MAINLELTPREHWRVIEAMRASLWKARSTTDTTTIAEIEALLDKLDEVRS